jgi:hypothetical protein
LPEGVQARRTFIPADADSGQIELTAAPGAAVGTRQVRLLAIAADARTEGPFQIIIRQVVLGKAFTNSIGMKLVLIPAGKFTMGSPANEESRSEDEEQHEVEVTQPFYLGVCEVTQEQYEKVMGNNPSHFNKNNGGGPTHPVENVSWEDAREFCKKLSELEKDRVGTRRYGLPTEAQWEYACRGGARESTPFHFGPSLTSTQAGPARRVVERPRPQMPRSLSLLQPRLPQHLLGVPGRVAGGPEDSVTPPTRHPGCAARPWAKLCNAFGVKTVPQSSRGSEFISLGSRIINLASSDSTHLLCALLLLGEDKRR